MANPLRRLADYGQSFWLDNLSRSLITSGELLRLIQEDGLRGITSNPTIFERAIASTSDYDQDIERLAAEGKSAELIFEELAIEDIQMAADLLGPVFIESGGGDGFVSLELPPYLATDTERSIVEARRLFAQLDRPNVMIKVPGTPAGIPAIEQLIADGVNVNITLLFSIQDYERVMEAYLRGIERRIEQNLPVDFINSVASFFVSRVDTEVDQRIEQMLSQTSDEARKRQLRALQGKVAIANAKIAYQRFKRVFLEGERFKRLQQRYGARIQRPLWASTSTKNPAYSDVLYIESLIGPYTVQTMAPVSVEAFRDHGRVRPTLEEDVEEAQRTLDALEEVGISYEDVTTTLQVKGVEAFIKSFDSILESIERKRTQVVARSEGGQAHPHPFESEVRAMLARLASDRVVTRLWQRDPSLWSADPATQKAIANRLGWLDVHEAMLGQIQRLQDLAADVRAAGFEKAVLLGMGGSSLAPEVLQWVFGSQIGHPDLIVLDTTNPDAIKRVEASLTPERTLFIVSSKSGTTVETLSLYQYFHKRWSDHLGAGNAGKHFIAITDPGTKLEDIGREQGFRDVFLNPPDIGGRYSALSYFGMVPAAIIGLDVRGLLERAARMAEQLRVDSVDNPGLSLGVTLGTLAQNGRDKITFVFDPALANLADWLEQLLAESTGKDGTGLIPVAHEPPGALDAYANDRVFVGLDLLPQPHAETDAFLAGLEAAGHPVIRLRIPDEQDLGAEFLRWEFATAVAGIVLGINPFDEPNVTESKDNTSRILAEYARRRTLEEPPFEASTEGIGVTGVTAASVSEAIERFLSQVNVGEYLAIMAFTDRAPEDHERLQEIRRLLRDRLRVATTLGYGPRFLHSTGQLYKGGTPSGAFLQIVAVPREDLPIPGQDYSFATLFRAQALGDFEALQRRGRPLLRVTITESTAYGLDQLLQSVATAAR